MKKAPDSGCTLWTHPSRERNVSSVTNLSTNKCILPYDVTMYQLSHASLKVYKSFFYQNHNWIYSARNHLPCIMHAKFETGQKVTSIVHIAFAAFYYIYLRSDLSFLFLSRRNFSFFLDYSIQRRHSQCTHTHTPYEHTYTNSTPIIIFKDWAGKSSRLTKSPQSSRCRQECRLPLNAQRR